LFKIEDGRSCFYQWDIDRRLIVEDASIKEVHFTNRATNDAYVCETYVEDGKTLANVPNILLQTNWRIQAYAYDGKHTKHDKCYEVVNRSKPEDYVYTETEVICWETFKNEVEAELEAMASKEYVDNEIATFDFIKVVDELPEVGLPNRFYLVPKEDTQTQDFFDEYIWAENGWEWLTTKQIEVDLTNYIPKTAFVFDEATETLTIEF
jgi:hypothetical protein